MKKRNFSRRLKASMMSFVMTASCVPAAMVSVSAGAVNVTSPVISVAANKKAEAEIEELGKEIGVGDKYIGYTAELAKSGLKTVNITFTPDFTGNFSCGFGIGVKDSPYWLEYDSVKGFIDSKGGKVDVAATEIACTAGEPVTVGFDLSKLDLKYDAKDSEYPGKFEFRNYYAGETKGSITVDKVEANGTVAVPEKPDKPDKPDTPNKPVENVPHNNKTTSGDNWSFKDNGDGTATIRSTVARQVEFEEPIVLTQGYDEDTYASQGKTPEDGDPINSHKFKYSDFGLTDMDGVTIESITAIIESDEAVDTFMYGGGLNVKQGSPADTEYAKKEAGIEGKESAGYWYNDCGEDQLKEFIDAGVKFEIAPSAGATMTGAGTYIKAYWEVPAEVQPYTNTKIDDEISFQYWYGTKAEQAEGATEPELVETVNLTSAVLTYTKEITVPYTDSISKKVGEMLEHADKDKNALHVKYEDLGIDETMDVYAIRFDISAKSDVDKLVYNTGTSVTADAVTEQEYWYQENGDYCVLEAGQKAEIMWIIPTAAAGVDSKTNYIDPAGEVYFGYYYGEADAISIDNIEVYYDVQTTTTTSTTATTTSSTTTTTATTTQTTTTTETSTTTTTTAEPTTLGVTLWGDANIDGKVSVADAVLIMQSLSNPNEFKLSEQGALNADVVDNGTSGVTTMDALAIQVIDINLLAESDLPLTTDELNEKLA
ncbi:MAG: DUF5620 domain-containing protein [Prevotella sp.]|nr:DUF5620 domain-containing protein [Alistipes senegalensis]MCM1357327.1 DUF5620 domain-containing protein [Prevotella sp.]MCM1473044.1 DUF5620 domain-containing protein [Muribaculaceae bacterium]